MEVIRKSDFLKMKYFDGRFYMRIKDNKIYKDVTEKTNKKFIEYLSTIHIPGIILPERLIYDGFSEEFYLYQIPLIKNAVSIREYIHYYEHLQNGNFPIDIIATIKEIFRLLDELHKYFIWNDVHNSNFLLTTNRAYLIDFDNSIFLGEEAPEYSAYYDINISSTNINNNIIVDTIKTLISMLSLYYHIDFENAFRSNDITVLLKILEKAEAHPSFIKYLDYLINAEIKGESTIKPFSLFSTDLTLPSEEELKRIRKHL